MNQKNRNLELSINRLAMTLESLEEYIRRANFFSDWTSREQFYNRTIPESNGGNLRNDEDHFFSNLSISQPWFEDEPESVRKETQKEFYKWIDHSGITVENCPENLKRYLNEINEMLEGRGDEFRQAYQEADKGWWRLVEKEDPVFWQANREVKRYFFGEPREKSTSLPKYYEANFVGNAEQGQKIFSQIKNSMVGSHEWIFIWKEEYYRLLTEKIKELKGKDQSQPKKQILPKESWRAEMILDALDDNLKVVELYIQKLNYYPNWEISKWTEKGEDWRKFEHWKNKNADETKKYLSINLKGTWLMLRGFKQTYDPDYYPHLINEMRVKLLQWQRERGINPINCPQELKQVFFEINEVLAGRGQKKDKGNDKNKNNESEEISKIIVEIQLEIANSERKEDLGSEFNDWKGKINSKSLSEAKDYQRKIREKLQAEKAKHQKSSTTNKNKLPLSTKLFIGVGIVSIIVLGTIVVYQVIKNKKVKK